ncbi:hypothetical protein D3C84_1052840 [compost metagenome]
MHAVERQYIRQHIDDVAGPGDLQLDHQVFQTHFRIETAYPLKRVAPEQQGRCRSTGFAMQKYILEIQLSRRQVALATQR